ncbi:MAG: nucleotide exchange factor GrpE [Alistipes sp.]
MKKEKANNEAVATEEGFPQGEGYPSCEGESCANVADEAAEATDTMTENQPKEQKVEPQEGDDAQDSEWKDKYLRLQAEFDNYRKRTLREKMDLVQSGGKDVLKAVLPVMDDVLRAVDAMGKSDDIEALRTGVNLISQKFIETMRQKGVTPIESLGQDFNPDFEEAVAKFAAGEEKKGKVVDVIQTGYMLGDHVLRFAKVVVGE